MTDTSSAMTLIFAITALAVVLALAWLLLKALSMMSKRGSSRGPMQVKATLPLGSRERLMVIEYHGNDYLLGVSANNVSLIDKHPATTTDNAK